MPLSIFPMLCIYHDNPLPESFIIPYQSMVFKCFSLSPYITDRNLLFIDSIQGLLDILGFFFITLKGY